MGIETALLAAAGAAVAGGGIKAVGDIQAGNTADAEAKYNAGVATNEGQLQAQAANQQAEAKSREVSRVMARQRLLIGSSGAGVGGTAEDVIADTAGQGELDALTSLYGGQLAKSNAASQARLLKARGRGAKQAGYLGALGDAIGTVGSAAQTYAIAQNPYGFSGRR